MSEVLAPIKPTSRIWAVGTINGDFSALQSLHRKLIKKILPGDRLIYLGNYWGNSTQNTILSAVNEVMLFRRYFIAQKGIHLSDIVFLRGTSEEMLSKIQQIHFAHNPSEVFDWMLMRGIGEIIKAYGFNVDHIRLIMRQGAYSIAQWTSKFSGALQENSGHQALLSDLKHAAYTTDGRLIFVHTGLDISQPLTHQRDIFWWGTSMFNNITKRYYNCMKVIRGASFQAEGIQEREFTLSIDGGAGRGGKLIAVALDRDGTIIEIIQS